MSNLPHLIKIGLASLAYITLKPSDYVFWAALHQKPPHFETHDQFNNNAIVLYSEHNEDPFVKVAYGNFYMTMLN